MKALNPPASFLKKMDKQKTRDSQGDRAQESHQDGCSSRGKDSNWMHRQSWRTCGGSD